MDASRTIDEIEKDIAATQERLATSVETLVNKVHPKAVAERSLEQAKDSLEQAKELAGEKAAWAREQAAEKAARARELAEERAEWAKGELTNDDGSWNFQKVAIAAGIAAGVILLLSLIGKLFKRG
ncbi:MAG: DUF3618 domain-containing protein [Propionibacteriaceae bacterium]|jgi:hypothetical protein|nr:DUF3618 domain-containing protein [Propionibacteriaceae bacterium]